MADAPVAAAGGGQQDGELGRRRSAALVDAAADALSGVNPLDLLSLEVWELVAERLVSVQDLWALTGACRCRRR